MRSTLTIALVSFVAFVLASIAGLVSSSLVVLVLATIGLLAGFVFGAVRLAGKDASSTRVFAASAFALAGSGVAWILGMNLAMTAATLFFGVHP